MVRGTCIAGGLVRQPARTGAPAKGVRIDELGSGVPGAGPGPS
jgi:hypothetical protein